jgi:peptidoglycan-associated lipoprotein
MDLSAALSLYSCKTGRTTPFLNLRGVAMRSRIFILSLLSIALLTTPGCARRQKATTAPEAAPPPAIAETAPAPEPTPQAPAEPAPELDPLGGDLASVNDYLRRQGLLADTFFDYDRASLTDQGREELARNAQFLRQYPQFLVTLEGHCDDRGTPEYNLALGERRAFTVRGYLSSLGIDEGRLRTMSYGEERPVCTDSEESCWRQNRRAHPVVTGRSGS